MNMLSLRVSSIKGSENLKKNSDIRHECANLPQKYLINLGSIFMKTLYTLE